MTSINETVQQSLASAGYGAYGQYAQPVVTALVDREQRLVGQIVEYATQQGLSRGDAEGILRGIGMEVPAPQPVQAPPFEQGGGDQPTAEGDGELAAVLGRIEEALSGLTAFARENGYRG